MHFRNIIRITIISFVFTLVSACGGGSDDSTSSAEASNEILKEVLVKPNYTGSKDLVDIPLNEATSLTLDILTALDMLNELSYSGVYDQFFIFPVENDSSSNSTVDCVTGTLSIENISDTHIRAQYNNCLSGGIISTGNLDISLISINSTGLFDMDIVPNLTMVSVGNDLSLTMNGYIKIRRYNHAIFKHISTYQLLLKNQDGEEIYLDDFISKVSTDNDDYGIDYSGSMYFSKYGKLNIITTEIFDYETLGLDLEIASSNTFIASILLGNTLTLDFGENTIPVTVSLSELPEIILDKPNEAPIAMFNPSSSTPELNENILLNASSSSDPDLDVLTTTWDVLSSPDGASWQISTGYQSNFNASLPGEYLIELSVMDPEGELSKTTQLINVAKGLPIVDIEIEQELLVVNQPITGKVNVENEAFDGPFLYRIVYGPDGMDINSNGELSWDGNMPNFGLTTEVNYAVAVSNSDKVITEESTLLMHSSEEFAVFNHIKNIRGMLSSGSNIKQKTTLNGKEIFVSHTFSNVFTHTYLNDDELIDIQWALPYIADDLAYAASYDVNNDGVLDHFLVKNNTDASVFNDIKYKWSLLLRDGQDESIRDVVDVFKELYDTGSFGKFSFVDLDNDGKKEILIDTPLKNSLHVIHSYSLDSLEQVFSYELRETVIDYCDIDNDGMKDIITTGEVYSISKNSTLFEYVEYSGDSRVIKTNNGCYIYDGLNKVLSYKNDKMITTQVSGMANTLVGNFDNDISQEVIYYNQAVVIEDWTLGELGADGDIYSYALEFAYSDFSLNVIGVLDVDGDDIDEIVALQSSRQDGTKKLAAYEVINGELKEKYSGVPESTFTTSSHKISKIHDDNSLSIFNSEIAGHYVGDNTQWQNFGSVYLRPGGEILGVEEEPGGLFYYATLPFNIGSGLAKYDENANLVWEYYSDERFDSDKFTTDSLTDYVFNTEQYTTSMFSKLDGTMSTFSFSEYIVSSPLEFGSSFILEENDYTLYQMAGDEKIAKLYSDDENDFWLGYSNLETSTDIEFIQYDEDEALEIIFNYRGKDENDYYVTKYQIIDSNTWATQTLLPGDDGESVLLSNFGQKHAKCFPGSNTCQNAIYIHGRQFKVIDKLSNETIYSSPQYPILINDLKFRENDDGSITFAISGISDHVFE